MEARENTVGAGSAPERSEGAIPARARSGAGSPGGNRDTEVPASAQRRRFSGAYKLQILEEADRCTVAGALGALLRREGLYSSHLSAWREARRHGSLAQLNRKRGAKPKRNPETKEVERLRKENARLRRELEKAKTVIEVQKKLSELLGADLETPESDGSD